MNLFVPIQHHTRLLLGEFAIIYLIDIGQTLGDVQIKPGKMSLLGIIIDSK